MDIKSIFREQNNVADQLAKMAAIQSCHWKVMNTTPIHVVQTVEDDIRGVPSARRVNLRCI